MSTTSTSQSRSQNTGHPARCQCGGSGLISSGVRGAGGVNILIPCPGQ